ncbi:MULTISPECIES: glycosyltransferase [unclassified Carboxylicivirga]|uniref:glycosyltransferase n=1 Tax=Carboxylicivirga TaxID=1628153 RepID=UPI003D35194B
MKVSVILSFYNKIEWLKLVLAGYCRQSLKDFEVIIADDGSKEEVIAEISKLKSQYPFPITHIWHPDEGWQKNIILNKAVTISKTHYLVFNDGDCIPHKHFVKEHYENRESNTILAGRRVNLSKDLTHKLTSSMIVKGYLESWGLIRTLISNEKHAENGIYFKNNLIRRFINKKDKGVLGSNFSLPKRNLIEINGFDERYDLPAIGEDTDLEVRWRNHGMNIKSVKHLAIQYHLFHKTLPRDNKHMAILDTHIKNKISWTNHGIIKLNR